MFFGVIFGFYLLEILEQKTKTMLKKKKNWQTQGDSDSDASTYDIRVEFKCISRNTNALHVIEQQLQLNSIQTEIGKQLKQGLNIDSFGVFEIKELFVDSTFQSFTTAKPIQG